MGEKKKKRNKYEGNEIVCVRLTPELIEELEKRAKREDTGKAPIIRWALEDFLDKKPQ